MSELRHTNLLALALTVLGALAVLAMAGLLLADDVALRMRAPLDKAYEAELLQRVQSDAAVAPELLAWREQHTHTSLVRGVKQGRLAWGLAAAVVALVGGAKWLITLRAAGQAAFVPAKKLYQLTAGGTAVSAVAAPSAIVTGAPRSTDVDLSAVDEIVAREGKRPEAAITILQALQAHYRYLPEPALRRVCTLTEISPAQLAGVASFYNQFRRTPVGEHLVKVCHGTACHVGGAARITDELRRRLQIAPGEDTDPTRTFTVEPVACMGCCTLAPVMQIDGVTHGHQHSDTALELVAQAVQPAIAVKGHARTAAYVAGDGRALAGEIRIGLGSCCVANGSERVYEALHAALAHVGVSVTVKRVGCVGMCHQTPFMEIRMPDAPLAHYGRVQAPDVHALIRRHFRPNGVVRRVRHGAALLAEGLFDGTARQIRAQHALELRDPPVAAFLGRQKHIATEHCGCLDPTDLDEYLRHDGFTALQQCADVLDPAELIERIRQSGLRGRGGAGFSTAAKWSRVRQARGEPKYIICNGDEGDPGAFMDRMLMESYPYRIIEGVAIAAHAVGAREGIFYIRREYPLAAERIRTALATCVERGLIGENAVGAARGLHLRVVEGAAAFVCGEETALIASLEGRRGLPTLRPPYPAELGLWGRPTLVNNVETYAVVPWIVRNGPAAFAALGTPTSTGTKVFALTGKVNRGGLIEVPMGITIREIVEDIGGGIQGGRGFKAVQIGGPSGGCVPAALADTPVDFEALAAVGAMMGSGGLVVLDETDCMVDIARFFLSFTQDQSCGKCTHCRVGTRRLLDILERICGGEARAGDLDELEHLARMVAAGSLCGLGKTSPNPVLTTLRYFRDEYEAHLAGRCPAGRCKALIRYEVTDECTGCTLCAQYCPVDAISFKPYEKHEIDVEKCTRCDVCRAKCPEDAIRVV